MRQTTPDPRAIPPEHLIDPRQGHVGFRGLAATAPPDPWLREHQTAERGGYLRVGLRWWRLEYEMPLQEPLMPVSLLYRPLFARIGGRAGYEQGWCVDA